MKSLTHIDYSQFLFVSQTNFTQTYFADHKAELSHDSINRMMNSLKLRPLELRNTVRNEIIHSPNAYVIFDDTVIEKIHSFAIETVRRQWSGNLKQVIKGIGVVTCVYVNPDIGRYWIIDYRIFDPDRDGMTKIDHLLEMWRTVILVEKHPFRTVLMDTWYASMQVIKQIESDHKIYYCPLKTNRQVSTSAESGYSRVDSLEWTEDELTQGKIVHIKKFPKEHQVKLFRIATTSTRTDYIITNDETQDSAKATKEECGVRWKIEQFHREIKQVTGLRGCQCRKQRAQRNHIACAMLVWVRMSEIAQSAQTTIYQIKEQLLSDYMRQQLANPTYRMVSA